MVAASDFDGEVREENLGLDVSFMYVIRQGTRVNVTTPAKLNLFFELTGRRPDGFHQVDTVMTSISLYDQLVMEPRDNPQIRLQCSWSYPSHASLGLEELPTTNSNLVYRAVRLLQSECDVQQGAEIVLRKQIPSQAGLGGGSSDAMAALCAANLAWNLGLSREELRALGAQLGSDVPFFASRSLARCTGRGEIISPLRQPGRLHFVVVKPDFGLSTGLVFGQAVIPDRPIPSESIISAIGSMDLAQIGKLLFNRLQQAAACLTPWVEKVGRVMERADVLGHQLSGSGTSYFALCRNRRHARLAAARLRACRLGQVFAVTSPGLSLAK